MNAVGSLRMRARRYRNLRATRHASSADIWSGGVGHELAYWRDWFATQGLEWPDDYKYRLDPDSVIQAHITRHLDGIGPRVRMLDAGAGALTIVGKRWPDHDLTLTAVDALADRYDPLLAEFGIVPPVRTLRCDTEHLDGMFKPASFDVAYASNTLDHSYDPLAGILQMIKVVRPGGVVLLQHFPDEAETEAYEGLHQWNFSWEDSDCVLWRPGRRWSLSAEVAGAGTLTGGVYDGMVTAAIRVT